jgi:hypothetical protein
LGTGDDRGVEDYTKKSCKGKRGVGGRAEGIGWDVILVKWAQSNTDGARNEETVL